ncbi:hypothetical protein BT63DRAFT_457228 [Microthyrium microscopicum]|uniref:Uncharacterized protein n=1 Tax=Microthyrium microscopicum TaxID=703497 RepID=A0A6A6U901_9PEZI|nr:hypothetical protein BT63DRAFT_457228 [Microthyrium microscopicum]
MCTNTPPNNPITPEINIKFQNPQISNTQKAPMIGHPPAPRPNPTPKPNHSNPRLEPKAHLRPLIRPVHRFPTPIPQSHQQPSGRKKEAEKESRPAARLLQKRLKSFRCTSRWK